ncbi:MAG: GGDEF domain-containing protein [Acidobacteriota bacterium]|nr:GGDEF domain-containing protein [Acidobacteriota bacterium]
MPQFSANPLPARRAGLPSAVVCAWLLGALLLTAAQAKVSTPAELEPGITEASHLTNQALAGKLAHARGDEEIALRFALLRRAAASGDSRAVAEQSSRLLNAAAVCNDPAMQKTLYAVLGETLSSASGEENLRMYAQHIQGQLIATEKMRQHLEEIQRNQQLQLEYMTRRAEMQRRITLLLGVCLTLTVVLAWSLWRTARSRREQALEDSMTGLKNRRFLQAFMGHEALRLQRNGQSALLLIADLDHFKQVNDRWGHDMGDRVLVQTAQTLVHCMRNSDVVVRWGGEEFVVVCPQSREVDAELICQRIRKRLYEMAFTTADGQELRISISIGVALFSPAKTGESWEKVLERADQCLYWVKQHGRDNWRMTEPQPAEATQVAVS